jgi:hypothetical protein
MLENYIHIVICATSSNHAVYKWYEISGRKEKKPTRIKFIKSVSADKSSTRRVYPVQQSSTNHGDENKRYLEAAPSVLGCNRRSRRQATVPREGQCSYGSPSSRQIYP